MKKYLFLAAASVALASCVNDEKMEITPSLKKISFDMPVMGTQTKAVDGEITGVSYPEEESFMVYAIQHKAGVFSTNGWIHSDNINFWNQEGTALEVKRQADGYWSTDDDYYWPNTAYNLSFAAYSPARLTGVSYDATGLTVTDFTVSDALPHIDLMYSGRQTERNEANSAVGTGVPVTFKHALSSVVFSAFDHNDQADYTINSISLNGTLVNKATFNEGLTNTAETSISDNKNDASWSTAAPTTVNYQVLTSGKAVTSGGTETILTSGATALLPIPQNETDLSTATVTINFTVNPVDASQTPYNVEAKVSLSAFDKTTPGTPIETWEMGCRYKYIINFGGSAKITFKPSVTEWFDGGSASYTIK